MSNKCVIYEMQGPPTCHNQHERACTLHHLSAWRTRSQQRAVFISRLHIHFLLNIRVHSPATPSLTFGRFMLAKIVHRWSRHCSTTLTLHYILFSNMWLYVFTINWFFKQWNFMSISSLHIISKGFCYNQNWNYLYF
jgi:hypothetical protein